MSHQGRYGRLASAAAITPVAVGWALTAAILLPTVASGAQDVAPGVKPAVQPAPVNLATMPSLRPTPVVSTPAASAAPDATPGTAVVTIDGAAEGPAAPVLPSDVQVVRFQGPPGLSVEVLAPAPTPVPTAETGGILTTGLKRGVGYRLRLSGLPERPGVELFPVIEVVGHLHRPEGIDPGKYPIRVIFTPEDIDPAVDLARLVTKVIYLEDPEQALPIRMPKDQIPVVTLSPTEHPLRVASALGRPVAIVRIGGRRPTVEEINAGATGDIGLDYAAASVRARARSQPPAVTAARCRAAQPAPFHRLRSLDYLTTNISATVATMACPHRRSPTEPSAASSRVTRSSVSTLALETGSSRESCPQTWFVFTLRASPKSG